MSWLLCGWLIYPLPPPTPTNSPGAPQRIGLLRGLLYLTVFGLAMGSLYFIADELMPTRMSANHLFNEAFDAVKARHFFSLHSILYFIM